MNHKSYKTALVLLIFALCALSVQAQSGRRQTKPVPAAPIPTPTPEPTPIPKKEQEEQKLIFLVGLDRDAAHPSIPLYLHSTAQRGCADRLRSRSSAEVDVAQRDMNRSDAIQKAKASTDTYVVLLTLRLDAMAQSYNDLQLDFVVFAPTTAKVVITGRSLVTGNRAGPVVVGRTSRLPGGLIREQAVKQAGEDAADRILKKVSSVSGRTIPK
jgi:hypothetical protein